MKSTMEYKEYIGSVEFDEEACTLYGKILGIREDVPYEGDSAAKLRADFRLAVDEYIDSCKEAGNLPEKGFKGSFNVRFKEKDLHRRAAVYAFHNDISLNHVVEQAVKEYLESRNY